MRHRKSNVKFGRMIGHYRATLRHLVTGLIVNKQISTTKVKAKQASRLAERLVTMGKDNTVASRRNAYTILCDRHLVWVLFNEIAPLFKERYGGYTRVIMTGKRRGDNAQMAILEFVERPEPEVSKKDKKKKEIGQPKEEEKHLSTKETPPAKKIERPKDVEPKHRFFKKFFGRKRDM